MLGWRCPSSSCTRSLMTVSCVWAAAKKQRERGTSGSGGSWRKQLWCSCPSAKGPALLSVGWAQLSSCPGAGWEQFSQGMGTAVQWCCTHPVSWSRVGDVLSLAPFSLSLFPGKHPSIEKSYQLKCPFCINLHIFSLPHPFFPVLITGIQLSQGKEMFPLTHKPHRSITDGCDILKSYP